MLLIYLMVHYRNECLQRVPSKRPAMSAVREALESKTFLKPNREHHPEEHDSDSEFETD
jgi:hypothetical protein